MKITGVRILGAYLDVEKCPSGLLGIAISGRSNVGKSTLLNRLTNHGIARTSKTPGRTRQLVYFEVSRSPGPPFFLVDLPGYGYASGPRTERERFAGSVRRLLADGDRIHAVLQLVDASVPWQDSDLEMLAWLLEAGRPFALVHTKCDRVKRGALHARKAELTQLLPWRDDLPILDTSAKDNEGIVGVRKWMATALDGEVSASGRSPRSRGA
jgi:GTP-binding protein